MYEQISKLDDIYLNLRRAMSLMQVIVEHFEDAKPDPATLLWNHEMHSNINVTAFSIVSEQADKLEKAVSELLEIRKSLKGAIV